MSKYLDIARQAQRRRSEPPEPPPQASAPPPEPATATATPQSYTPAERQLIGDLPADVRGTLDDAKAVFGSDAEVVSVEPEPVDNPRREAAWLIREARQHDREHAVAIRDCWRERLAVCVVDGGLSEREAERIALAELRGGTEPAATLSVDPAAMSQSELQQWISTTHEGTKWHLDQCSKLPV